MIEAVMHRCKQGGEQLCSVGHLSCERPDHRHTIVFRLIAFSLLCNYLDLYRRLMDEFVVPCVVSYERWLNTLFFNLVQHKLVTFS